MRTRIPRSKPTENDLSVALGFRVPDAFVRFVTSLYELNDNSVRVWPELFTDITGLHMAGEEIRYPQTPPELFPFAAAGVDGIHYGYVIHAPELSAEDYPVGDLSPSEDDGVEFVGSNTLEALENLISSQLETVEEDECLTITRVSKELGVKPTAAKALRLYDASGNGLPVIPMIPANWRYIPSADGIGVLGPAQAFRPGTLLELDPFASYDVYLTEADQAFTDGFLATTLYYLREAYWYNWTDKGVALAISSRLAQVYDALGRNTLAEVVERRSKLNW